MEKQDIRQRRLYANNRMVVAIDRLLEARTDSERKKRASGLMLGVISAKVTNALGNKEKADAV